VEKRKPQPKSLQTEYPELAAVRAEVVRALNEQPPDVTLLTAALDRVDSLLDVAREELLSALREAQSLRRAGSAVLTHDLIAELAVLRGRDFFPWG
jgi:CBS-domain-containing membrane protein